MMTEIIAVTGSLVAAGLFVWFMFSTGWQIHLGILIGMGICYFAVKMLHGFWIGDERYRKG